MEEKKQTMCVGLDMIMLFYIFLRGRRHVNHRFFLKKKLQYTMCRQPAKNPLTTVVAEKLL